MVALRKLYYWSQGMNYDFGNVPYELFYEYRKDVWSFAFVIIVIKSYQFIVTRLQGEAALVGNQEEASDNEVPERFLVKKLGREFIVKVSDIDWLESSGNYVNLHCDGRVYPMRATLSGLIEKISDRGFCRVHRSHGVNLDAVVSITPLAGGDSEIKLKDGHCLMLSRRYKEQFKMRL